MRANKLSIEKLQKIYLSLYLIFVILSLSSIGIIAYTSYLINMPLLKLWKELYIFILFILSIYLLFNYRKNKLLKIIILILGAYCIWVFWSLLSVNLNQIIYQIKLDLFNILFTIVTISVMSTLFNDIKRKEYINKILKITIILAIVNAIVIIFQGVFSNFFVTKILGLEWGAWARDYGITVVVAGDKFRAIGLMNNYIPAAEIMIISIILLNEGKKLFNISKFKKNSLIILFIIAIYFTTYKTGYLWIGFYGFIKLCSHILYNVKNTKLKISIKKVYKNYENFILVIYTIAALLLQWIVSNTFILYGIIEKLAPNYAYTSIYLRVEFHQDIIGKMQSLFQKIFGLGMGLNGIFVGKVDSNVSNTIPLDSSYIYILSNYGFLGIIMYLGILIGVMALAIIYNENDKWGIKYIVSYLLCIQFFFNNLSTSIPVSYVVIILIVVFIYEIKNLILKES